MGFKENLKSEITFQGMRVKELAEKTGINKRTLDHYLTENGSEPTAANAVLIAKALGVSVEYLVTGKDRAPDTHTPMNPKIRRMTDTLRRMSDSQLDFVGEVIHLIEKNVR